MHNEMSSFQSPSLFHITADNIDIIPDILDEKKSFHATQMVTFQCRGRTIDEILQRVKVTSIRSLNVLQSLSVTRVCNYVLGKTEPLLPKPVREEWYAQSDEICLVPPCIKRAIALDMAFIVTRDEDDERKGWTTFNQGISIF